MLAITLLVERLVVIFFCKTCLAEGWQLWRMYSHWRFFIWPTQNNLLFFGEWEHPLPWHRRERLWPYYHCYHIWLFHLESKGQCQYKLVFALVAVLDMVTNLIGDVSPQFSITKENRGNEGTCIGVSRWPVRDHNHHTTTDMWLYRAYSGNLYHGGELIRTLPSFTQGDTITCILDMEAHTISFAKNDKVQL